MSELLLRTVSPVQRAAHRPRGRGSCTHLLLGAALKDAGLAFKTIRSFATPRRLTVVVDGLPARSPDIREERKGPRPQLPTPLSQGKSFLKSAGLTSIDQAEARADKKGDFYVALIEKRGSPTADVVAAIVPRARARLPLAEICAGGATPSDQASVSCFGCL